MIGRSWTFGLIILICATHGLAQPIWDYDYPNSVGVPTFPFPNSMGGNFFRPPAPPLRFQPPNWPPPSQFVGGPPVSMPPSTIERQHHQLPSPSYRSAWRGTPWAMHESLTTSTEPNRGDLDSLLARIVTRLPAIAEGLSRIVVATTPSAPQSSTRWEPWLRRSVSSASGMNADIVDGEEVKSSEGRRVQSGGSAVVNSMPDPAALFSFGKLIRAFSGSSLDTRSMPETRPTEPEDEKFVDVESIQGVPILKVSPRKKDEDQEAEIVEKSDEVLFPLSGLLTTTSASVEETDEPFVFTFSPGSVDEITESSATTTENPADNLLGSLLNGKLDRVDWLGSIFGHNRKENAKSGDGNALAQLFSGGFLGSAVSSDDEKQRKQEERNFH